MARIRKPNANDTNAGSDIDNGTSDDLRRFIDHAADMIAALEAIQMRLADATAALEKAAVGYNRTAHGIEKREREGITVKLESEIGVALRKVKAALADPIFRAESIARRLHYTVAFAGVAGSIIGAGGVIALIMFRII
ncbi:hypothetical protein [Roseinatronobacter bogoriensis]|uniref:Uncharacterized protein n=1 Tax=Roseinatronobacter bogoriensis subsp. barguzinensis TaxID=441209 RepID=A0A2K8K6Z7_9RHOB|nr:hypothetical protein [Rhodobaca]ATX65224.1 hypothetical protein BG454_04765 [Rhodobaca barguzinensis]MBB4209322.1 hypothetical protein [Rhodobaca bogoriensis DSM 18756]TDW34344.1 hypothetical protein LY39_03399 [Rhodobaca barguzinensis]TDY67065.1 hypothetical protein EV660_10866 [Rhodobaca bogoriensis DSM 18756]